jgi:hypothetical protein
MNWLDFSLGVLFLAIVPMAMAIYGGLVAAEAITEESSRRRAKLIFWTIGVLGVVVAVLYQYRAMKSDETRQQRFASWQTNVASWQQDVNGKLDKIIQLPTSVEKKQSALQLKREAAHLPRYVNAKELGKQLKQFSGVTAAIWNDGTNEPGALAKQIEIGLEMANWTTGGNNIKMGDPSWFPDSLTIELSSKMEPSQERAHKAAKELKRVLKTSFQIDSEIRYTDQVFPRNFMRIKVASQ